jgi:WD40 repeat protein
LLTSRSASNAIDAPSLVHALSPQTLLLGTDSSALHLYDLRALGPQANPKPDQTHHPHDDYISSLTPLPASAASTSGFSKQWVSTGGTTLAVTDLRRGVMVRSEDQEEELLCSVMVTGLSKKGSSVGEKVVVGGGNGVLTLWERGVWDDQDERITVDRSPGGGESVDSMALLPQGVGPGGKIVVSGLGNGALRFVKLGSNQVIAELSHDELEKEAVVGLGFDATGRMISGGGRMVKVWGEASVYGREEEVEEEEEDENGVAGAKHERDSDDEESDEEMEDSSEDERPSQKRKKRRKGKAVQQKHTHGIMGFSGLD